VPGTENFNRCGIAKWACVTAPGNSINSTVVQVVGGVPTANYGSSSGTSMSGPHAAATLGLFMQRFPYMNNEQVLYTMETTSRQNATLSDPINTGTAIPNPGAGQMVQIPDIRNGWGTPNLKYGFRGPAQFLGRFAVDTQGFNDVWSNDISNVAMDFRKTEDDAEAATWAATVAARGWTNGLPPGANADDTADFTIGTSRANARATRNYVGSLTKLGTGTLFLGGNIDVPGRLTVARRQASIMACTRQASRCPAVRWAARARSGFDQRTERNAVPAGPDDVASIQGFTLTPGNVLNTAAVKMGPSASYVPLSRQHRLRAAQRQRTGRRGRNTAAKSGGSRHPGHRADHHPQLVGCSGNLQEPARGFRVLRQWSDLPDFVCRKERDADPDIDRTCPDANGGQGRRLLIDNGSIAHRDASCRVRDRETTEAGEPARRVYCLISRVRPMVGRGQDLKSREPLRRCNRLALTLLLAFFATAGLAQEPTGLLKKVKDTGTLNVGYAESPLPFSYLDRNRSAVGYSIDVCKKVIDAVKAELKKPDLKVAMQSIKADDAASYVVSGVIDIHCGPILNTWQNKSRVDFGFTYFVQRYRFASHESAHMNVVSDMQYRTFVTTNGAAMNALQTLNASRNFGLNITTARSNEEAFRVFRDGGVQAVFLDEISLAQGVAKSPLADPSLVMMSDAAVGAEPFSLVFVKGDAPFKNLVLNTMQQLYTSGGIRPIYHKWFTREIPPEGISLNLPVSDTLDRVFHHPTDSPDPALYQ
jgi:ABC-type amino acid transport substrate-binding protein